MKLSDFYQQLKNDTGLPSVYHHWTVGKAPALPYTVYYVVERDDMIADDKSYFKVRSMNIELYTDSKDEDLEARVESFLNGLGIVPYISEQYIDDEKMYEVIYEFDLEMEK
ncbi:MAG: hypothetical protein LKJ07_07285 [Leuconostoc mesenteroides]|jgi:hypothetical protein|nr:hypothetical protein [Leuconostoc mesenteroides]MCI1878491.1 hypothetical protein [Leuconostoc mesenteroides]MCI1908032.1 hypothetical protein [Leuconostoc mesenteroides]